MDFATFATITQQQNHFLGQGLGQRHCELVQTEILLRSNLFTSALRTYVVSKRSFISV